MDPRTNTEIYDDARRSFTDVDEEWEAEAHAAGLAAVADAHRPTLQLPATADARRDSIVDAILESVRVHGRANTALQGAERVYDVVAPALTAEYQRGARAGVRAFLDHLIDGAAHPMLGGTTRETLTVIAGNAVSDAVAGERSARVRVSPTVDERERWARQWHEASDHAHDGSGFGGFLCNCERVVERAIACGWLTPSPLNPGA